MSAIAHIARREWTEQLRQPGAVLAPIATFAAIDGLVAAVAFALARIDANPARDAMLAQLGVAPALLGGAAALAVQTHAFLGFSQLIGLCAVNAGQAVLHDRQSGTLSFLLMSPVTRGELLAGKLLGAIALPLLAGSALNLAGAAALLAFPPTAAAGVGVLPTGAGWWVAWALGGPAWCAFTAAIATGIGAISRDVRTAQQGVWFVLLFAAIAGSGLITSQIAAGPAAGLAVAALGAMGAALALAVGSAALSRDLWR
jgi:ABC-type Na+ efflux pump permease subunit